MATERRYVRVQGNGIYSSTNYPGITLLDISEPQSAKFRMAKSETYGVDGYHFDEKAGYDGYEGWLLFETTTQEAFEYLIALIYPGFYGEFLIDYEYPKGRFATVKDFTVDEIAFSDGAFIRNVQFNLDYQPHVQGDDILIDVESSPFFYTNKYAPTDSFRIGVQGSGAGSLTIGNKSMEFTNVGRLTIDNENKELIADNKLVNDRRKKGFYYTLEHGSNSISFSGGITGLRIYLKERHWA